MKPVYETQQSSEYSASLPKKKARFSDMTKTFALLCLLTIVCIRTFAAEASGYDLFARTNLVAWCIVPFDAKKRDPEERAEMLERLGFKHFAYDWRAEHIPSFDAEVAALKRHGIALDAFWVAPGELNRESRIILDLLEPRR